MESHIQGKFIKIKLKALAGSIRTGDIIFFNFNSFLLTRGQFN